MKKLSFIFVFFGFFVISASSQADYNMCQYAQRADSVEAWTEYLESFPYGDCAPTAKARLKQYGAPIPGQYNREDAKDEEACKNARLRNNVRAWRNYLNNHPNGWCKDEAQNFLSDHEYENENEDRRWQRQIESRDYEDRKQERNEEKYNRMAADDAACQQARDRGTAEAWYTYIRRFPDGRCASEAEMELRKMKRDQDEAEAARAAREQAAKEQQLEQERQRLAAQQQANQLSSEQAAMNQTQAASGRYWSPVKYGNWAFAKTYCQNLTYGGYSGWHLPTISELRTLVTQRACSRTHPGGECPITDGTYYQSAYKKGKCHCDKEGWKKSVLGDTGRMWSATQSDNGRVWYIYFNSGSIYADDKSNPYNSMDFRCVR